ncbi:MAG: MFS transporter [Ktedonobacteraceae bacterium]|nr:MFS transporter [Ktedonobacteraceae bacterium]
MPRRSVVPLVIGTFVLRMNTGAGGIVLGLFLARLAAHTGYAITSLQVGLLSVVFFSTELTLAPAMGALSDRWGRRLFMIVGPLLGLLHVALLPFTPVAQPLPYLLGLQVIAGLSSAITIPTVLSYLADFTARDATRRVRLMSFYELATSGGIGVGVVLGGFAWDHVGRGAFGMLALFYLTAAFCMFVSPTMDRRGDHGQVRVVAARYLRILRTPRLFIFIPAWICLSALLGVWFSSQLTFVLSKPRPALHQLFVGALSGPGGGSRLSLVLGGYVLFFGLCLLFWAFFLKRVPRLLLMLTSVAGVYLACVALLAINHGSGSNPALVIWIPVLLIGSFAESSFAPSALAYLADLSEESVADRGLLMGLYSVFLGLGQLLGNGLGGVFAHTWGFDGLIYLTVLLACVALISLLALYRQERRLARRDAANAAVDESNVHEPSAIVDS